MLAPYHVRLAVSQYGEQFRAELFTEDLGDTEGDLLNRLPPEHEQNVRFLAGGGVLAPETARELGKYLFGELLGQKGNSTKWAEVLAQAARKKQPIRLLIDTTTEVMRDLPYGLLCEPHHDYFLFRNEKAAVAFVRIIRRCSPRPLKLRARLRVLVAVAEPKNKDMPPFDAPRRLQTFAAALHEHIDIVVCGPDGPTPLADIVPNPAAADAEAFAPVTKTTRDAFRGSLVGEYDVVHLLAHGYGAGVWLCTDEGAPAETTAGELGAWCGAGRTALAFLQVCKGGQTDDRGGFGGVAQQLLNPWGGNLAAVVASTFPLDAEDSTRAAIGFYRQLAAGKPPEVAITAERPETDWCWAFLELWARPGALGGTQQRAAFQYVSPYRGLTSFSEQDADLFFGRKAEVAELLQILRAEPAVAVVGDSGSGKTSLLHAGLVHAVRREGLAGQDKWRIVTLRPGYRPAQALFGALTGAHADPTAETLKAALRADSQPLFVILDQFEEAFILARDKAEVQMLTTALADAVNDQRERFRLIIGMRSEFLGQAASVHGLSRLIRRPWVLRPPSHDDLRDIVAGPAEHCGYAFQGPLTDVNPTHAIGLLDRILADPLLAREKGERAATPLPLLQFALERLWLKAVEKGVTEFTHAEFDEIGGMGEAIAQHADAVFQASATATEFGAVGRPLAEQIITALVSAGGTRQPRVRDDLQTETGNPDAARVIVDYLVGERLLTVRSDPEDTAKSLVDLSHEALIHNWDRLRGWLAEDPQGRAMREEFSKSATQWAKGIAGVQPRSRRGLPSSDLANTFLAWVDNVKPKLGPIQTEFATALREMLARQRRVRRSVTVSLAGLTFASLVLAVFAWDKSKDAETQTGFAKAATKDAIDKHKQALKATEQSERTRFYSAMRVADLSWQAGNGFESMRILGEYFPPGRIPDTALVKGAPGFEWNYQWRRTKLVVPPLDHGYPVDVRKVSWSRDSTRLATWSSSRYSDGKIRVWDLTTGKSAVHDLGTVIANSIWLAPDGTNLAVKAENGKAWLWNVATGILHPLDHGGTYMYWASWSPDGARLATYAQDKKVRVWDAASVKPVELVDGVDARSPAWSPDGTRLALPLNEKGRGRVRVWDVISKKQIDLEKNKQDMGYVAWSPDGKRLGTWAFNGPAQVWDVTTWTATDLDHGGAGVRGVSWSANGHQLATAAGDGKARVWDPATGKQVGVPFDHAGIAVDRVAWSPVGTRLATVAAGKARVWDVVSGIPSILDNDGKQLNEVSWSACGYFLASAIVGKARVWDAATGERIDLDHSTAPAVDSVTWSPTGTRLVSTPDDGRPRVWDLAMRNQYHLEFSLLPQWSPNGAWLVTTSNSKLQVWDVARQKATELDHDKSLVGDVIWAPNRNQLATKCFGMVQVWSLEAGIPVKPMSLLPHGEVVLDDFSWSPDGTRLATAARDHQARVWDVATEKPIKLDHFPAEVFKVSWAPDGARLATVASDGKARVWDLATQKATELDHSPAAVRSASWDSGGLHLITLARDGKLRAWDVANKEPIEFDHDKDSVDWVKISPDGTRLASGTMKSEVRVWNLATRRCFRIGKGISIGDDIPVHWSQDGIRLVAKGTDSTVRLWDVTTETSVEIGHSNERSSSVTWSPDSARVAIATSTGNVRLFDGREGHLLLVIAEGRKDFLSRISWSPDGHRLLWEKGTQVVICDGSPIRPDRSTTDQLRP